MRKFLLVIGFMTILVLDICVSSSQTLSISFTTFYVDDIITDMGWHPDSNSMSISGARGLWTVNMDDPSQIGLHDLGPIRIFKWSGDGTKIALTRWDGTIEILEASTWQNLLTLQVSNDLLIGDFDWSYDDKYIATYLLGKSDISIWNSESGNLEQEWYGSENVVSRTLAWHPATYELAVGYSDGNVILYQVGAENELFAFNEHPIMATMIVWHPSGEQIASGGSNISCASSTSQNENSIFVWNVETGNVLETFRTEQCGNLNPLAWNLEGTTLAYTTQTGTDEIGVFGTMIDIINMDTGELIYEWQALEDNSIAELEWQPNGEHLAYRKNLRLNTANSPRCTQQLVGIVDFDDNSGLIFEANQQVCSEQ